MPDEPRDNNVNPYESPKSVGAKPTIGSPTLRIVTVVFLSIATLIAVPIVFLSVCIAATIGVNSSGVDSTVAIITGFSLAAIAIGLLIFGMIRLGIWLLKPRQSHTD